LLFLTYKPSKILLLAMVSLEPLLSQEN
jgi:hypothetical protein